MLGEGLANNSAEIRNTKENKILCSLLIKNKKLKILDIGSVIGRWANNLISLIDIYHGIDFSKILYQRLAKHSKIIIILIFSKCLLQILIELNY